jgi:hypothetical protein
MQQTFPKTQEPLGRPPNKETHRSWDADSCIAAGRRASVKSVQWIVKIGIVTNRNAVGQIRERPPRIGWSESIIEDPGVDYTGAQTTESKTAFRLLLVTLDIVII